MFTSVLYSNDMDPGFLPLGWQLCQYQDAGFPQLKWTLCCLVPWSVEGHAVSPLPCETGHACSLIYFFILLVIVGITNALFFMTSRMSFFCSPPSTSNTVRSSMAAPLYLIISPTSVIYLATSKKQCIVNSLPEMRSNTYGALPTTLFITINVSSPLHPLHTFITLLEMSNAFATVITPWWPWGSGRSTITKNMTFFLLCALCCTAESLNH